MNFRNKYLVLTVRILLGLLMTFSGVMGFIAGSQMKGTPPEMLATLQPLWSAGIMQLIKATELVAGLMLLFGVLPALAAIFLAPVMVGLLVYGVFVVPSLIPFAIVLTLANAYFGYVYWEKYKAIFSK